MRLVYSGATNALHMCTDGWVIPINEGLRESLPCNVGYRPLALHFRISSVSSSRTSCLQIDRISVFVESDCMSKP